MPTEPIDNRQQRRGCGLSAMLTFGVIAAALVGLYVLTLGALGPILLVIGCMFAIVAFHYFVWGWWLSDMIKEEADDEPGGESSDM